MSEQDEARDAERLESGRKLFAGSCTFLLGVTAIEALPPADLPEIAFAGRSNVGKSSLINALTGHHNLARTSNTPGRTQELNAFLLGDRLRMIDMPGYGYAEAPVKKVKAWTRLIHDYLRGRPNLRRVYLLIDARHGIKKTDEDVLATLDKAAVSYQVVLTKADKVSATDMAEVEKRALAILSKRPAAHPQLIATSSVKGGGIDRLRAEIADFAG